MNLLTAKWPFYISGTLLALMMVLSFYVFDDVIGLGDAMTVVTEYCGDTVMDRSMGEPPPLDWQLGLLIGLFVGSLVGAVVGNKFKPEFMSDGDGSFTVKILRTVGCGMLGGFLTMLGIQLAGDSVFGQLAAAVQLSGGAWVFLIAMSVTGCALAILLERRGEGGASGKPAAGHGEPRKSAAKGK